MKQDSVQRLDIPSEPIKLDRPSRSGSRGFVAFLICCSVLIAAFAISGTWGINDLSQSNGNDGNGGGVSDGTISATNERAEATSPAPVMPDGATPIVDQHTTYGGILLNETIYAPDMEALRAIKITVGKEALKKDQPLVLILHTHAQEAYLPQEQSYVEGRIGDSIYSEDPERTVVAVGEVLCETLNRMGIGAIQCKELHGEAGTLKNSYVHAAECVKEYLEKYPGIQCVIDLHRDGILTAEGELVRTVSNHESALAQVMTIIGTDGNGTPHPKWKENLALAIRLFDALEAEGGEICRRVELRNASYNQELAPYSLLLEIGSAGNTVQEAKAAAVIIGEALAGVLGVDQDLL